MKINLAIVVTVVETKKNRIVTARVPQPWDGNPWEDYSFLDNDREFTIGDEVEISAAHLVQSAPEAASPLRAPMRYLSSRSHSNNAIEILTNMRVHILDMGDNDAVECGPGLPCEYCQAARTCADLIHKIQPSHAKIWDGKSAGGGTFERGE